MTLDIHVMAWDSHKNVMGLHQLIGFALYHLVSILFVLLMYVL